jgi:hypothetical protein
VLQYLGNTRNTTLGVLLHWILKDMYGVEHGLTAENVEDVFALVQDRAEDTDWHETVLEDYCGIEASVTVVPGPRPDSTRFFRGREGLLERFGYYSDVSALQWLESVEAAFGREIATAQHLRDYVEHSLEDLPMQDYKFIGLHVPAYTCHRSATEVRVTRIIEEAKRGKPTGLEDKGRLAYFAICAVLDSLRAANVRTIQMFAGAEVLPPSRSITRWGEGLTGAIARIAGKYEDFQFCVGFASDVHAQDLGILAKHVPNINVLGYWWHSLYPFYIRKSIETRLDMVPVNKIIGYFSDAYHCEWCYPKLKLVKHILKQVLVERVLEGWYTLDAATDIVDKILYENPKRIYGV